MFVIYRSSRLAELPRFLAEAAVLYSQPLLAVAAATLFGWLLAYFQAPQAIGELVGGLTGSPTLTVLAIAAIFIVFGTFMDAIPAIIIFMPIVDHLVDVSGAHPLHTGLVVVMTLAMGLITPPYGLCLLLACAIGRERVGTVMPQMLVFYALFLGVLLVIILFPSIALFLPRLVMPQFVG
jgi:TRAP-type C4-dicarboxylate transport system permease large subunit